MDDAEPLEQYCVVTNCFSLMEGGLCWVPVYCIPLVSKILQSSAKAISGGMQTCSEFKAVFKGSDGPESNVIVVVLERATDYTVDMTPGTCERNIPFSSKMKFSLVYQVFQCV